MKHEHGVYYGMHGLERQILHNLTNMYNLKRFK
jgi:hypothetical protein